MLPDCVTLTWAFAIGFMEVLSLTVPTRSVATGAVAA